MKQLRPLGGALRLEIEDDPAPGQLVNLIQNPTGTLGGWGWITPVAGTAMTSHRDTSGVWWLDLLIATGGQPTWLTSEPLPVAAGRWVIASYLLPTSGAGFHRVRFEWLDVNRVLLSSSAQSGYVANGAGGRPTWGAVQAPASTAYVRLRFDVYSSVGGAAPTTAVTLSFTEATVATAATSGELGTVRTNLVTNPSFETGTGGWTRTSPTGTLTQGAAGVVGTKSLQLNGSTNCAAANPAAMPIIAGKTYTLSAWARVDSLYSPYTNLLELSAVMRGAATQFVKLYWLRDEVTPGTWLRKSVTFTATPGKTSLDLAASTLTMTTAGYAQLDGIMFEEADAPGAYFDGDTTDTAAETFAWSETAHASTSTAATLTTLPYLPPPTLDILGPSHDLTITREGLNVGTLSAHIVDATLDPATSTLIRPGRAIRLMAFDADLGAWRHVFTGAVSAAQVTYDLKRSEEAKRAEIELAATDNGAALANQNRADGYATIDELPAVLEGCGVPWNVNGSGAQVTGATLAAINENASALDQVAVTRDSVLGYAWVDRMGTLQAWDRDRISGTVLASPLDENVYRDVVVGYNTEALINEVRLKFLRLNPGDGTSEEVPYGPYRDEESIREWGVRSAEFTIQGIAEELADLDDYAQAILDASAVPQVRLTQMDLTVELTADGAGVNAASWFAFLDLYDLVETSNTRAGLVSEPARVSSIKHTLSGPESKWLIEVGFEKVEGVASPTFIPSPTIGAEGQTIGDLLRPVGEVTMFYGLKTACPSGWLVMDGGAIGPEYPDLRAMVGSSVLPDMTDRFPIGAGSKAKGTVGGLPTHIHPLGDAGQAQIGVYGTVVGSRRIATATHAENFRITGTAGTPSATAGQGAALAGNTDNASEGLPPWRALWFIIRCGPAKPVPPVLTYAEEVAADTPLGYWPLGEPSGTTLADASGNSRTGTIDAGVTLGQASIVPADSGTSWALNAWEGGQVNGASWMAPAAALTAEAWVYLTAYDADGSIVLCRSNVGESNFASNKAWALQVGGAGQVTGRVYSEGGVTVAPASANGVVPLNTSCHLALVQDGTNVLMYCNGVQVASAALAGVPVTYATNIKPLTIGKTLGASASSYVFNGRIQHAAFYGTALSPARILAHYDAGT